jgi:hypothetical protein
MPAYDYLIKNEGSFYSSYTEKINYSITSNSIIYKLYNNLEILHKNGLCGFYITYFNNKEDCEHFLGGKDGIMSLGFSLFINFFIEEIRNARNFMKVLLDNNILVGNLSNEIDINCNDTTYGLDKNETLKFRMIVFNLEQTHSKLNIIFLNIVLQCINQERIIAMNTIVDCVNN